MPWEDGTGPQGEGPMTGRGMGYCAGYPVQGSVNPVSRRSFGRGRGFGMGMAWRRGFGGGRGAGFGRGFGRGFGWRRWNWAPVQPVQSSYPSQQIPVQPTKEQEIQFLEQGIRALGDERKALDQELGSIKQRLKELKNGKK